MTRSGRFVAAIATASALTVIVGILGSAGGCSDPGPLPQVARNEAGDQAAQEKMREYMERQGTKGTKGQVQKGTR
jgi:hypothetical protein